MKQLRALYKRVGYTAASFVLALSTLTAAVPFILSENVGAAGYGTVAGGSGFNSLTNWKADRAPVSSYNLTDEELTLNIKGEDAHPNAAASNNYRKTEGMQAALPAGTSSVKATLHVDSDWESKIGVRAGLWAYAPSSNAYPIIEFSNRDDADDTKPGATVIRAWDSSLGWVNLPVDVVYGAHYDFEIVHNQVTSSFDYYVNGSKTASSVTASGPFTVALFNNYNSGIDGNNYSVTWTNLETGKAGVHTSIDVSKSSDGFVGENFTVSGDAIATQGLNRVYVQLQNRDTNARYGDKTIHLIGKGSEASWSHTFNAITDGLPEGDYRATVGLTAIGGETYKSGWTEYFTLDTTAPEISFQKSVDGMVLKGDVHTRSRVVNEAGIVERWTYVNDELLKYEDGVTKGSGSNSEIKFDTNDHDDGETVIKVVARDSAGNESEAIQTFTIDNTAPTVSIDGVEDGEIYNSTRTVTGSVEDANYKNYYLTVTKNGVPQIIDGVTHTRTADNFEFELSEDGYYVVKFEAIDTLGNKDEGSVVEVAFTIDTAPPVIELNGGNITLTVGDIYAEQGATVVGEPDLAVDVFGGVDTSTPGTYVITYTAEDAAGNEAEEVIRVVTVLALPDTTAPVITLNGDANVTVSAGSTYTDAGAIALDDVDGAVTVAVTGSVDTSTPGTYTLTYTATDASGNVSTATRTVVVESIQVTPLIFPAGVFGVQGITNPDLTPEVESESDDNGEAALGATTENAAQAAGAAEDASLLGLAWYWWVVIGAAILAGLWWLIAAIRGRSGAAEA